MLSPAEWSLLAVPPAAALHLSLLPRLVDTLQVSQTAVLAASYVPGGPRLVDQLHRGEAPTQSWGDCAFLAAHEYDGPTAFLLLDTPVAEVPTDLPGRVQVPGTPEALADLLFGCGCHGLPDHLPRAGHDRSDDLLRLAHSFRDAIQSTTPGPELRERFVRRCTQHADLLTLGPPAHCERGAWRAGLLRWVVGALSDKVAAPTLASWQLVQQDVLLAADDVELQVLRSELVEDLQDVDGGVGNADTRRRRPYSQQTQPTEQTQPTQRTQGR